MLVKNFLCRFHCYRCMDNFKTSFQRDNHYKNCVASKKVGQIEKFSPPGSTFKFLGHNNKYLRQLIGAFDFEALLETPTEQEKGQLLSPCGGQCGKTM